MSTVKAYDEIVDFIAASTDSEAMAAFRPSAAVRARVADLVAREKDGELDAEETSELNQHLQLEHLMRLVKARAHQALSVE